MGIADPERLGIIGHSYGGYSALALIAETERFKAAVMSAGYGDLMASYGEMAGDGSAYGIAFEEGGQGLMGGPPWQLRDRYIENSPIFYLDRITTPLLIVHGGNDKAVDPFLAAEVFVGLRRLGRKAEYAKYEGEDHAELTWSYANQLDYCNRMINWFDLHLKDRIGAPNS
jgi:dipeptidyl aminopeptidase/acylaminoacyl peptidase